MTAAAISSGLPLRPIGICEENWALRTRRGRALPGTPPSWKLPNGDTTPAVKPGLGPIPRRRNSNHRTLPLGAGLRPRRLRRRFTPDATATATAKTVRSFAPRACKRFPAVFRAALVQTFAALALAPPPSPPPTRVGDSPPLALATRTRMAGGQGVPVRTATAKPFKSQGATNMSNDRARNSPQRSTNPSPHYALRPTPRSSQKPISRGCPP